MIYVKKQINILCTLLHVASKISQMLYLSHFSENNMETTLME